MDSCVVVIGSDNITGSTARVCSGFIRVAGDAIVGKIINGLLKLDSVFGDIITGGSDVVVAFKVQRGNGKVPGNRTWDVKVCYEVVVNGNMGFLMVPLEGRVSRDQLSYACNLAAPFAASPLRKIIMSVVLVR